MTARSQHYSHESNREGTMMADWVVWEPQRSRGGATSRIGASGSLYISAQLMTAIGRPERLTLLWDAKQRLIGVRAAVPEDVSPLKATRFRDTPATTIGVRTFLRWAGLPVGIPLSLPGTVTDGVIVLGPIPETWTP